MFWGRGRDDLKSTYAERRGQEEEGKRVPQKRLKAYKGGGGSISDEFRPFFECPSIQK